MHYQKLLGLISLLFITGLAVGQERYIDRAGTASFFSEAPLENISAHNRQVLSIIDMKTAEIAVSMLMKSFIFEKALMQEHFNEKYVESDKYPKAIFKGTIDGLDKIDLTQNGTHTVQVKGMLTIHGETNPLTTRAVLTVENGVLWGTTSFPVKLEDYNIKVPSLVIKNIAETVAVDVKFNWGVR